MTTNSHRYEVTYRLLTDKERTRIVNKEIEVIKNGPVNILHTVTESMSGASSEI
jgi:hypothetical protein